ncbi:hypothetical protein BKG91_03275 [Rodentibacter caecimuris]|uniref:Uncharacterized protein n=1 Tax=Rodentibacter caecimuris TaxID=1796644 RepID=A0A9X8YYJ9_9PAST|nr:MULTISPECIES: hypothetical protein [Pasteurellaceae]AOF53736.1 hypothetical protein AC062_1644 [Pasteurellaceae bacterium NI1060]MCQ9124383.1 hypothetical protein [Rodentibacter heylii]MCR1838089.1 hypothetical protein [Pasteurella caecimuris]MCU0107203.1 hypothetical protein [Pasteurella caecimuris]MCX2962269.1 hypothetical protein [Rodentibacter heylii]
MKKLCTIILSLTLLSACSTTLEGSSKLREQNLTSIENKIIANVTTKNEVREFMGEPTQIHQQSNLDEIWYYESYEKHSNYTPVALFPITLPLSIVFGHNFMKPSVEKKNEKQLRVKIDTGTNKVTNVSTAVTNKSWY